MWLDNARHANQMALRLYQGLHALPGVTMARPPQANSVFAHLPDATARTLRAKGWQFYGFIAGGGCRFMCSWDTDPGSVDAFVADVKAALSA